MASPLQPYLEAILAERDWSWTVVGLLYVLAAWFVRSWFVGPVCGRSKVLARPVHRRLEAEYLKRSILGWALFFIPLGIIILIWRREVLPVKISSAVLAAAGAVSFVLSIVAHLMAYGIAAVVTLKDIHEEYENKYVKPVV